MLLPLFDTCLRLTGIKSVRSISYDGFVLSAMVFNLQILVSWLEVTRLRAFDDRAIALSIYCIGICDSV